MLKIKCTGLHGIGQYMLSLVNYFKNQQNLVNWASSHNVVLIKNAYMSLSPPACPACEYTEQFPHSNLTLVMCTVNYSI